MSGFELLADVHPVPGERLEVSVSALGLDGTSRQIGSAHIRIVDEPPAEEWAWPIPRSDPAPRRSEGAISGRPLRLVAVTHSLGIGGAQRSFVDLVRLLRLHGSYEISVLNFGSGELTPQLTAAGISVNAVADIPLREPLGVGEALDRFVPVVLGLRPDVLLVNTLRAFPGAMLGERLSMPIVWAVQEAYRPAGFWHEIAPPGAIHARVRAEAERLLSRAEAVVFRSKDHAELYASVIDERRRHVIPFDRIPVSVDRRRRSRLRARAELGLTREQRVLLCVGRLEPRKGQSVLVEALDRLRGLHPGVLLVLLGGRDPDYGAAIDQIVTSRRLEDTVRIEPEALHPDQWLVASDLLVSASDVENLSLVVLEAATSGLPVVTTRTLGVRDVFTDGETGWLADPCDLGSITGALDRALGASRRGRRRIARAAAERVGRLRPLGPSVAQWASLLESVAARHRAPSPDRRGRGG